MQHIENKKEVGALYRIMREEKALVVCTKCCDKYKNKLLPNTLDELIQYSKKNAISPSNKALLMAAMGYVMRSYEKSKELDALLDASLSYKKIM